MLLGAISLGLGVSFLVCAAADYAIRCCIYWSMSKKAREFFGMKHNSSSEWKYGLLLKIAAVLWIAIPVDILIYNKTLELIEKQYTMITKKTYSEDDFHSGECDWCGDISDMLLYTESGEEVCVDCIEEKEFYNQTMKGV